ncbi:MAG: sigma-70 family RNA polymerase sigma factor [Pseudomonadota bacterium]
MQRLLDGSEPAFRQFFDGQFPRLYRFVLARAGGDEDLAEELAQSTICTAMERLHSYRGEAALTTWLFTICRNRMVDLQRRSMRRFADVSELEAALESLDSGKETPVERARERDLAALVNIVLDAIPPRYSEVLLLKYRQELSMQEIGEQLGSSAKAVESLLTRARNAFKEAYRGVATLPSSEIQSHES